MLQEYLGIRQEPGTFRRFFSDERFHLYVWYTHERGHVVGFQLVVLEAGEPDHALTWEPSKGSVYTGVWTEDEELVVSPSPVLVADGLLPKSELLALFQEASSSLEPELRRLVLQRIEAHGG